MRSAVLAVALLSAALVAPSASVAATCSKTAEATTIDLAKLSPVDEGCTVRMEEDGSAVLEIPFYKLPPAPGRRDFLARFDLAGPFDFSECEGLEFDLSCGDISAFTVKQLLMASDGSSGEASGDADWDSYYTFNMKPGEAAATGWRHVTIRKSEAKSYFGHPAGFGTVKRLRFFFMLWHGFPSPVTCRIRNLRMLPPEDMSTDAWVVAGDVSQPERASSGSLEARTIPHYEALKLAGLRASVVRESDFPQEMPETVRLVVLPRNDFLPKRVRLSLESFAAHGGKIDAVVHCGDLTDLGYLSQLDVFISAWRRVMPPGIPLVAAFGNRDLSDTGKMSDERRAMDRDKLILSDSGSAMKRLCGWSAELGMRSFEVKGVPIVAADWRHEGDVELFMAARPRLRSVAAAEMLISVQHPHPQGTVFGAAAGSWMADDGRATCYFRMFPRVVSLSGHSHRPFASADSSWRGDFSAFAAGSFYLGPPTAPGGKEASVLTIFGDHAEIERRDISTGFSEVLPVEMQAVDMAASPRKANGEFVFAQWNIGHYSLGRRSSTDVSLDESAGRAEEYRRMLEKVDADFLGICEYSSQFDKGGGLARKLVFGAYRHFECGPNSGYQCNAIASSKVPLSNISAVDYPRRVQPTYRMSCEVQICGKRTVIVETHLDLDPEARRSQIEALANEFGAEERVILSGDFNIDGPEEFAPLMEAGFAAANFGAFGVFNTHRRRKVALTPAIDNVFVKGFSFCGVRVEDATLDLSDHRILVCRIRVE